MSTRLPDEEIACHEAGHTGMSIIEGLTVRFRYYRSRWRPRWP